MRRRHPKQRLSWGGGRKDVKLIERFKAWLKRRYWTPKRQLEHLRIMVQTDHRWLAHDRVANALTERYLAALAPDWYQRTHMDIWDFRESILPKPKHSAFNFVDGEDRMLSRCKT